MAFRLGISAQVIRGEYKGSSGVISRIRTGELELSTSEGLEIGPVLKVDCRVKPEEKPKAPTSPKPRKKKSQKEKDRDRADDLAREWCKRTMPECCAWGYEINGKKFNCSERLEWAHLKSRGVHVLRHDNRNAISLCNTHHRFFTVNPDLWREFCEERTPGVWDYLNGVMCSGQKPDYQRWIDFYLEAKGCV